MPELCAYGVSVGNSVGCRMEDFLMYYAENPHVNCIAAYVEGVKDATLFEKALHTAALNRKPVVVMKSGRSRKGMSAAASHTGNLAGDYASFEAILKRYGVVITDSLEEFNATARMFAVLDGNFPHGNGLAAVNFSGGENTICADLCEQYHLELPSYEPATEEIVKSLIPPFSTARNPLDPTTDMFSHRDKVKGIFSAISRDANMDMFVLGLELSVFPEAKDLMCLDVLEEMHKEGLLLPTFLIPSFEKGRNKDACKRLKAIGVPMLATGCLGYKMLTNLCRFVKYSPELHELNLSIRKGSCQTSTFALSESDSKEELSSYGLRVPKQFKARNETELLEKLCSISYPVVLKVDSPDILHKTDAGGVILNINTQDAAVDAFKAILTKCRTFAPQARIEGVLVQEMVPTGTEMIVGVKNDPTFGPLLLCGMGGIFVEVFQDVVLSPCPINQAEALEMLSSLKASKLLNGYRGSAPCDVDALCDLMVNLSKYASENCQTVSEIDLNPVFVYSKGNGVIVTDALILKYKTD